MSKPQTLGSQTTEHSLPHGVRCVSHSLAGGDDGVVVVLKDDDFGGPGFRCVEGVVKVGGAGVEVGRGIAVDGEQVTELLPCPLEAVVVAGCPGPAIPLRPLS